MSTGNKRVSLSCIQCRERKTRCDGRLPCSACESRGVAAQCHKYETKRVRRRPSFQDVTNDGTQVSSSDTLLRGGRNGDMVKDSLTSFPEDALPERKFTSGFFSSSFKASLPGVPRLTVLLTLLHRARYISQSNHNFDFDAIYYQVLKVYEATITMDGKKEEDLSFSDTFLVSSALLFASGLNGCQPLEEHNALYEGNRLLRKELVNWPLDLSILQGYWMLVMALIWSSRSDEAFRMVDNGLRSAVTMGIQHAPLLANFAENKRGKLLDALLHLASQACLSHALFGTALPIDPGSIDVAALLSTCPDDGFLPSQTYITRFKLHAKAWRIIEPYYRDQDGVYLEAPKPEELTALKSVMHQRGEHQCHTVLDAEIIAYLNNNNQAPEMNDFLSPQVVEQPLEVGAVSDRGVANLMLLSLRFLRIMVNYPFSYEKQDAQDTVMTTSRSIFLSAFNLTADAFCVGQGTLELHALITLRCLAFLEQYRFTEESGRNSATILERLKMDINIGRQAVMSLNHSLRVESSAFKQCQRLIAQQVFTTSAPSLDAQEDIYLSCQ